MHPILAGLAIPSRRPPRDRPVPRCAIRVLHSGCRWVSVQDSSRQRTSAWHLSWIDRPGATLAWRGCSLAQHPGLIVLIPPGLDVRRTVSRDVVHIYLTLLVGQRIAAAEPLIHRVGPRERELLRRLARPLARREPASAAEGLAMQTLVGLALAGLPDSAWPIMPTDRRIRRALLAIEADPVGAPGNAVLAAAAGLSLGRFLRLFRSEVGTSPQRLRLDLRLERAAAALSEGATVKAAAQRGGWRGRARFSTAFRRRFGCGPATWRRTLEP